MSSLTFWLMIGFLGQLIFNNGGSVGGFRAETGFCGAEHCGWSSLVEALVALRSSGATR